MEKGEEFVKLKVYKVYKVCKIRKLLTTSALIICYNLFMVHKLKIAVLRGGPGYEYESSMKMGSYILKNLSNNKYVVYDVSISRDGDWFLNGIVVRPEKILMRIDLVFNAVKGNYAKGRLQKMLDDFAVPYTGSGALSSAISTNKFLAKKIFEKNGMKTPYHSLLRKENYNRALVHKIFREIPAPFIVKPVDSDISFGVDMAYTLEELIHLIEGNLEMSDAVLVKEYIRGKEIVCGVIKDFRGITHYTFLPTEIKRNKPFLCNLSKLNNDFDLLIPTELDTDKKNRIKQLAIDAHESLDLGDYSHSDFIVSNRGDIYLLETNIIPDIQEGSVLEKMLEASGSSLSELIEHLVQITRRY